MDDGDSKEEKKSFFGRMTSWVSNMITDTKTKKSKEGKCKGFPTREMRRVFMYSLENLEQPGQTCDSNDVKYTCRGHRKCVDGKCQGSAYYNELKLHTYRMEDYQKLEGNSNSLYSEEKNVIRKKKTSKVLGKVVKTTKSVVKATGRCFTSANCDRSRQCLRLKKEKIGTCFGQQEESAKVCKFTDKA